jgi:omega-6 fatty acid desaturase / acyl-lipid omega-6 desaturase (Delta-12 desaturase)
MTFDQVFVPRTRSDVGLPPLDPSSKQTPEGETLMEEVLEHSPLVASALLVVIVPLCWPAYLLTNLSGPKSMRHQSHFDPNSALFKGRSRGLIVWSDIGVGITIAVLGALWYSHGGWWLTKMYIAPYLIVNFWLVIITYLQHTDPVIPHYRDGEWTFVRGALTTVDRDFGFLNIVFHAITNTHVVHHLFSMMPHYNAHLATKHIRKVLGEYYLYDSTPWPIALWNAHKYCRFVEDTGEVVFWRN